MPQTLDIVQMEYVSNLIKQIRRLEDTITQRDERITKLIENNYELGETIKYQRQSLDKLYSTIKEFYNEHTLS